MSTSANTEMAPGEPPAIELKGVHMSYGETPVLRDTDMQAGTVGATLDAGADFQNLRRGDLVFWKGHVGILTAPDTLLHASGHVMRVYREPLREARDRIRARSFGEITAIKRLG